uniref:Response regulatory domain-containing protein n=1 Tax=Strombidium rassoulzadegani TaxID=1082188 RepID=A0A7S3CL94_9SPIT|mmetsp:Transcript_15595/g.26350  ORF Transcript_15595/g.26350 Transcript_15595/m.26350 type:complete len:175 (+) Transcript_15595:1070-1594(+)
MLYNCQPLILVVDENPASLEATRLLIKQEFQLESEAAEHGLQAVEMFRASFEKRCRCRNRCYKLILMDTRMPEMEGLQASRQIMRVMSKQGPTASEEGVNEDGALAHIVCLTSSEDGRKKCRQAGVRYCVNKPLDPDKLFELMLRHFYREAESEVLRKVGERRKRRAEEAVWKS